MLALLCIATTSGTTSSSALIGDIASTSVLGNFVILVLFTYRGMRHAVSWSACLSRGRGACVCSHTRNVTYEEPSDTFLDHASSAPVSNTPEAWCVTNPFNIL